MRDPKMPPSPTAGSVRGFATKLLAFMLLLVLLQVIVSTIFPVEIPGEILRLDGYLAPQAQSRPVRHQRARWRALIQVVVAGNENFHMALPVFTRLHV